eukprot:34192_1
MFKCVVAISLLLLRAHSVDPADKAIEHIQWIGAPALKSKQMTKRDAPAPRLLNLQIRAAEAAEGARQAVAFNSNTISLGAHSASPSDKAFCVDSTGQETSVFADTLTELKPL